MIVASVDYPNKRVYLHPDTIGVDLDTMEMFKEVRALRASNDDHQKYRSMVLGLGNVEKISGLTYTSKSVQLLYGCRIIPYDADQNLRLIRDTFTDDGVAGRDCFDRSGLSSQINIDVDFPEIETRVEEVNTGSGLSTEEHNQVMKIATKNEIANEVLDEVSS